MHAGSKGARCGEKCETRSMDSLCPHDAIVSHLFRPDSHRPVTDRGEVLGEIRMALKSIDWNPVSRKDVADLLGIVLSFSITRNDTTLFRPDHELRRLERGELRGSDQRGKCTDNGRFVFEGHRTQSILQSTLLFNVQNERFHGLRQLLRVPPKHLDHSLVISPLPICLFLLLLCRQSKPRRTLYRTSIVTRWLCRLGHDDCFRSMIVPLRCCPCVYRIYLEKEMDGPTKDSSWARTNLTIVTTTDQLVGVFGIEFDTDKRRDGLEVEVGFGGIF